MSTAEGRTIRLSIEKIVYPGRRLARSGGRVYFTDEGLPGETVQADILREHASYTEARTTAVLEPSPDRLPVRCGHYLACGSYQPLPYAGQLALKKSQAVEIFGPSCPGLADGIAVVPSPREWRYRNKIRFSLFGRGPEAHLAYHVPGSRVAFVAADEGCSLASEKAAEIAGLVLGDIRRTGIPGLAGIEVRESEAEGTLLLNLYWKAAPGPTDARSVSESVLKRFSPSGIVSWIPGRKGLFSPRVFRGADFLLERAAGTEFEVGPGSFFQVNTAILPAVIEAIDKAAGLSGGETVADMYGGVGTFGLTLAKKARRVLVVESAPENLLRLKNNIARNRLDNVEALSGLVERRMAEPAAERFDLVVVDPPRKGLDRKVVQALLDRPAGKIVYLSCNPSTLARDIGFLKARYAPLSLTLFDFFPQTPHIETLAVLTRN
jgi:23S rRNA (uracil1939-C5)-methyltransferase